MPTTPVNTINVVMLGAMLNLVFLMAVAAAQEGCGAPGVTPTVCPAIEHGKWHFTLEPISLGSTATLSYTLLPAITLISSAST